MQMMKKRGLHSYVSGVILVLSFVGTGQAEASRCSGEAHATAAKFLRVVYEGAFIGGSNAAFSESLKLTMNDGDPPSGPIVVTTRYAIASDEQLADECHVTVVFHTAGTISEDLTFHRERQREVRSIWVNCSSQAGCRVHMDDKHYGLPPHVGKVGILSWLRKFQSGDQARKAAALNRIIGSL